MESASSVFLYRAMSQAEHDDLIQSGTFREEPQSRSLSGKWFAESPEHAEQWGNRFYQNSNFRIVEVMFPSSIADAFFRVPMLDGIGSARYAEIDQLIEFEMRTVR